jgi:hypothetical protein
MARQPQTTHKIAMMTNIAFVVIGWTDSSTPKRVANAAIDVKEHRGAGVLGKCQPKNMSQ